MRSEIDPVNLKKFINRETVSYVFFGVLATLVNYAVFWLFYDLLFGQSNSLTANLLAFLAAVVFAFVTNKLFVFESKSWAWSVIRREIPEFFAARVFTFLIEELGLFIADTLLNLGRFTVLTLGKLEIDGVMVTKVGLAVVTITLNYIANVLIFKKKK